MVTQIAPMSTLSDQCYLRTELETFLATPAVNYFLGTSPLVATEALCAQAQEQYPVVIEFFSAEVTMTSDTLFG